MRNKLLFLLMLISFDTHAFTEKDYVKRYCTGEIEVVLPDKTRVDCETSNYAIEYDFGRKWAEAIGQSLHYSRMTNKKAGVVLIMRTQKDCKYVDRINDNIKYYWLPIKVQTVGAPCKK